MHHKLFPLENSLGFWLYRVHTQGAPALRKEFLSAGLDLMPEQWAVMARLHELPGMSQSRLGQKTFKDRHNINRIVNLLEKRGLIERRPDEADKRANCLFLTAAGQAILELSTPVVQKHLQQKLSGISKSDLELVRRILERIVNNMEKINADGKGRSETA